MIERQVIAASSQRTFIAALVVGLLAFGAVCFIGGMRVAGWRPVSYDAPVVRELAPLSIPKWTGSATLQDSTLSISGSSSDFLTLSDLATFDINGDAFVSVECPNSCTTQSNGMRFCFAVACAEPVHLDTVTINGDPFKDGTGWREYRDVVLNGDEWVCTRTGRETKCHNGAGR